MVKVYKVITNIFGVRYNPIEQENYWSNETIFYFADCEKAKKLFPKAEIIEVELTEEELKKVYVNY